MTTEEIQRTICNVVDYKTEIEPYPLVKIYSGVGSGKSYFAGKMITGSKEYDIPAQNVLIITSRRAKVKETLKELGVLATEKITKMAISALKFGKQVKIALMNTKDI